MRELSDAEIRLSRQFGDRIRDRRRELGYTQEKLADMVGANRRAISELERGKGTSYLGLSLSVAEALGFNISGMTQSKYTSSRKLPRL